MDKDFQESLIDAIQILLEDIVKKTPFTSSQIGLVKELNGFDAIVEIYGSDAQCKLAEHLQSFIKVGDIVIIQDLENNDVNKFIVSKIGSTT